MSQRLLNAAEKTEQGERDRECWAVGSGKASLRVQRISCADAWEEAPRKREDRAGTQRQEYS